MVLGIGYSLTAFFVSWFLSGFGIAFILVQEGETLCQMVNDTTSLLLIINLLICALLCKFLLQTGYFFILAFMIAAPAAALFISRLFLSGRQPVPGELAEEEIPQPKAQRNQNADSQKEDGSSAAALKRRRLLFGFEQAKFNSERSRKKYRLLLIQQLLFSVVFSFGQFASVCYAAISGYAVFDFFWIALFFSGVLFLMYGAWLDRYVRISSLQLALLLITSCAICFIALAEPHSSLRFSFCVLLCMGFTSFDVLSMYELARTVSVIRLPFASYFAFGRLANASGMFIGWLLVYLTVMANGGVAYGVGFQYVLIIVFFLLVIYFTLSSRIGPLDEDDNFKLEEQPDGPIRINGGENFNQGGFWKCAIKQLSGEFHLSPREIEVFELLSRGRDNNFICDSLIISASTVKTHSYHIYQKMGIHSQQELISAVEERTNELRKQQQTKKGRGK